LSRKKSGRCY